MRRDRTRPGMRVFDAILAVLGLLSLGAILGAVLVRHAGGV